MELKISDGSYSANVSGGLNTVFGVDETAQRIVMKLSARRGEFLPLPNYGSRLHTLHSLKPSEWNLAAAQFVVEALADEPGLSLVSLDLKHITPDSISISLQFSYEYRLLNINTLV